MARRGSRTRTRRRRIARRGGGRRSVRYSRNGGGMLDDVKSWGSSMWNRIKSSVGYGDSTYVPSSTYGTTSTSTFGSTTPTTTDYSSPTMPDYSASSPSLDTTSFLDSNSSLDTMSTDSMSNMSDDSMAAGTEPGAIGPYQNLGGRRRRRRTMRGGFSNSLTKIGLASPISGIQTARAHNWVGGGVTVVNDGDNDEPDFFIGGTAHCRSLSAARRGRR